MRWKLIIPLLLFSLLMITACNRNEPTPSPTGEPTIAEATATTIREEPTTEETAVPVEEATSTPVDLETVQSTLAAMLLQSLRVNVPVTSGVGIDSVVAFPLETRDPEGTDNNILWLAHTVGIRSFEPEQNHLMAIYRLDGEDWHEAARAEFAMSDDPETPGVSPDYLGEGGVSQVQVEPTRIWIQVEGGVGAHSGVYGLFSFDGSMLTEQLDGFSSSPGVGWIEDLNGDGINEVLLDSTDYYVFCYACGVRDVRYNIWYWDGTEMLPAELQSLSEAAPEQVRTFNENLLALVNAGLWKDAQALLDQALIFSYTEPALQWNLVYVRTNAEARQANAEGESAYPLLGHLFYGDYAAAVELLREVGADGLFVPDTELIAGTVADGWQTEVADRINSVASAALVAQPDLAAAYFVRGWGEYVRAYDETAAVADVQKAAEFAPDDVLYRKSVEYLTE